MLQVMESPSSLYVPRTRFNVRAPQATVVFAVDASTRGEQLTRRGGAVCLRAVRSFRRHLR
jgi:hypothetical protein